TRERDKGIVAIGTTVQVVYDYESEQSIPLPEDWRNTLTSFEPGLANTPN
ncbi:MAG: hypothetical protein GYB68_00950, partial [Chloroflexi bacterium]|nr:hypothetical protein [Chloroflexota bacterium]